MLLLNLFLVSPTHAAAGSAGLRTEAPNLDPSASAQFEGEICFSDRRCEAYIVDLNDDGTLVDSLNRRGTYQFTGAGLRDLLLDFDRVGDVTLGEGEPNCWDDPGPGVNGSVGNINVCQVASHQVANFEASCPIGVLSALPGEDGHWSAGRVSPGVPMWVQSLRYSVNTGDSGCGSLGHSYQVFVGDADAPPPASPTIVASGFTPSADLGNTNNHIVIDLPSNTFVDSYESIFASVEMVLDGSDAVCQFYCLDPLEPDMGYWSNAVSTPYSWQDLNVWGIGTPQVTAYGLRLVVGP